MIILADTSIWIDFFAGRDTPQTRFFKTAIRERADVALTGLILSEILQGIPTDSEFARIRKVLSSFRILHPLSDDTYTYPAKLYRTGRKRGVTIRSLIDCLIASIAIEHGALVLHKLRDFERISEYAPLKTIPGKTRTFRE
jgi:predicted nucleic acid-binding protein